MCSCSEENYLMKMAKVTLRKPTGIFWEYGNINSLFKVKTLKQNSHGYYKKQEKKKDLEAFLLSRISKLNITIYNTLLCFQMFKARSRNPKKLDKNRNHEVILTVEAGQKTSICFQASSFFFYKRCVNV